MLAQGPDHNFVPINPVSPDSKLLLRKMLTALMGYDKYDPLTVLQQATDNKPSEKTENRLHHNQISNPYFLHFIIFFFIIIFYYSFILWTLL